MASTKLDLKHSPASPEPTIGAGQRPANEVLGGNRSSLDGHACAIVVTFQPTPSVLGNLRLLLAQVPALILVDNGSSPASLEMLRSASRKYGFVLLENGSNLGIAAALNRGVGYAETRGYKWVILFDQDSCVTTGFFDTMFTAAEQHPRLDRVAVFSPQYIDRASGVPMPASSAQSGELAVARTSGSLMPMWVFKKCGWFRVEFFIDQVDFEYCLNVRSRGYEIAECQGATLLHTLGRPTIHRLFGVRLFGTTNHTAARRYYLVRNRTWLLKRYWASQPRWCAQVCAETVKETVRVMMVEDCRWSKLGHTLLGVCHGVLGRMGKTMELP